LVGTLNKMKVDYSVYDRETIALEDDVDRIFDEALFVDGQPVFTERDISILRRNAKNRKIGAVLTRLHQELPEDLMEVVKSRVLLKLDANDELN
jgi:hypothetical protein